MLKRAGTKLSLLIALSLVTTGARATPPSAAEDLESAIQAGIELRKSGNDTAALDLFLELDRKNPGSVRLMLQVTAAAQASGRWLVAHEYLRRAAAFKGDAYYQRNRVAIKGVEDAVAQHVGQFRVVGAPAGAEVRLSGSQVGTLPMSEAVPVELGSYTLEVSKPGYYYLRREVTLAAGGALNQEVVELKPRVDPPSPLGRVTSVGPPSSGTSEREPERAWWRSRTLTWVLGGATVAAAATAGGSVWLRERSVEKWNDDSACLDTQQPARSREEVCGSERQNAQTYGAVALGAGVAAAALATATLTQLLLSGPAPRDAGVSRAASCQPGFGSFICSGSF